MDYTEMNHGSWASYLTRFEDLLRPQGIDSLGTPEESVEAARDQADVALATISSALPELVFEGYRDWYNYQDEWVLRNLGQVLTAEEENEILSRLDQGSPEALGGLLDYIANQRLTTWQTAAREEFAPAVDGGDDDDDGTLTGLANTANWQASRTPGTYYYTYSDDRYLYCDLAEAPAGEWETLPVRDRLAAGNAEPWGDSGWYLTPTGEPDLYGGAFVFASDLDGPWMTEDQARAQLEQEAAVEVVAPRRYDPVEAVPGDDGWARGFDTEEGVWKFARIVGGELPGDDAPWTAADPPEPEEALPELEEDLPELEDESDEPEEFEVEEEDIQAVIAQVIEDDPEYASLDEAELREIAIEVINEVLSEEDDEEDI